MTRTSWLTLPLATLLIGVSPSVPSNHAAAQVPRTLDLGGPPGDSTVRGCASDSFVTAALLAFNGSAAVHVFGGNGTSVATGLVINGGYAVFEAPLLIEGTINGDVVVLNGSVRIGRSGVVGGSITVLGGSITTDAGGRVSGRTLVCEQGVSLSRGPDNLIVRSRPAPSFGNIWSAIHLDIADVRFTPHVRLRQYNRVEGLPVEAGFTVLRALSTAFAAKGDAFAILRTARDPSGSRPSVGWQASGIVAHREGLPFWVGVSGGWTIRSTEDQQFSPLESGLSALVLRRDYNDWFLNRGVTVSAGVRPMPEVTVNGSIEVSRQNSVPAVDAFSLFRNTAAWRPNPLIDDGKFTTSTLQATWDARDERDHQVFSWYAHLRLQQLSSDALNPVTLPTTIRDPLPASNYSSTTADIDIRAYLRLDPEQRVALRLVGGGYFGGDPLTIQQRRATGGVDPLLGYDFRAVNCDRRRKVDPAIPALCDRNVALQGEYRRTLSLDVGTRIGSYHVGLRNPDVVLFGDIGSAWLAGSTAGRVPTGRIQALSEWKADVGIGIVKGPIGLFVAKALVDEQPVRLTLRFSPHI